MGRRGDEAGKVEGKPHGAGFGFYLRQVRKKPLDSYKQRSAMILLKKLKDHSGCYLGLDCRVQNTIKVK